MTEIIIINMVWMILQSVIKNPAKKEALRNLLLRLRDHINILYPDSVTFAGLDTPVRGTGDGRKKSAASSGEIVFDNEGFTVDQLEALAKLSA